MSSSIQFHSIDAFEVEGDAFRLSSQPTGWKNASRQWGNKIVHAPCCTCRCWTIVALSTVGSLTLVLSILAIVMSQATWRQVQQHGSTIPLPSPSTFRPVSRIAFGSCTSHDLRPQPIWEAVVAAQPDAWIWVGDMAYTDNPLVDCK